MRGCLAQVVKAQGVQYFCWSAKSTFRSGSLVTSAGAASEVVMENEHVANAETMQAFRREEYAALLIQRRYQTFKSLRDPREDAAVIRAVFRTRGWGG